MGWRTDTHSKSLCWIWKKWWDLVRKCGRKSWYKFVLSQAFFFYFPPFSPFLSPPSVWSHSRSLSLSLCLSFFHISFTIFPPIFCVSTVSRLIYTCVRLSRHAWMAFSVTFCFLLPCFSAHGHSYVCIRISLCGGCSYGCESLLLLPCLQSVSTQIHRIWLEGICCCTYTNLPSTRAISSFLFK